MKSNHVPAMLLLALVASQSLPNRAPCGTGVGPSMAGEEFDGGTDRTLDQLAFLIPSLGSLPLAVQRKFLEDHTQPSRDPQVRALAAFHLLPFAADAEAARRLAARHGFLSHWTVFGPEPAAPGHVAATHRDFFRGERASRVVASQILRNHGPAAQNSLSHLVSGDRSQAFHVALTLRTKRAKKVALSLGANVEAALSLNGAPIGSMARPRHAMPGQATALLNLTRGVNVLFMTFLSRPFLSHPKSELSFYARLASPFDGPAQGVDVRPWVVGDPWPAPRPGRDLLRGATSGLAAPTDLLGLIQRSVLERVLGLPARGSIDGRSLETLLVGPGSGSLPVRFLLQALKSVPAPEAAQSVLLHHWIRGNREPGLALALADLSAQKDRPRQAQSWLKRASGAENSALARVAGRVHRLNDAPERAWTALVGSSDAGQETLVERAFAARGIERPDLAEPIWASLAREKSGDPVLVTAHFEELLALGRVREALETLAALGRRRADDVSVLFEQIRLAMALSDEKLARTAAEAAMNRVGNNANDHRTLAQFWEGMGEREQARRGYGRALQLSPSDGGSRRALARMEGLSRLPLPFSAFDLGAASDWKAMEVQAFYEVLREETHITVRIDGGFTRYQQRFIRVQRVPEAREMRTFRVRFDPSARRVKILHARVHRGDLSLDATERGEEQVSEEWYGLYYDEREAFARFEDLRVGDIIEMSHRQESVGAGPLPGSFELMEPLQGRLPVHQFDLYVSVPTELGASTRLLIAGKRATRGRGIEVRSPIAQGGHTLLHVRGREVRGIAQEPKMPGRSEVGALFQVTTFGSFGALASAYGKLIEGQKHLNASMRAWLAAKKVRVEAAGGGRREWVRAISEGIAQEIRYVGLEFGIHGFQPYSTDQVWARRFGDCKDQATLLVTLLAAIGVEAQVALVRTRSLGILADALPALGLFNHAIVWLPESQVYIDPSDRTVGHGRVPASNIGGQVLRVSGDTAEVLDRIPAPSALRNAIKADYSVVLRGDGRATVEGKVTFTGLRAAPFRKRFSNKSLQAHQVALIVSNRYPGAQLNSHSLSDPSILGAPLELHFSADAPAVAEKRGAFFHIPRPIGGDGLAASFAPQPSRQHPIVLGVPSSYEFRFTYLLPQGWQLAQGLIDRRETSPFGAFEVRWVKDVGAFRGEVRFRLDRDQVSTQEYPAFYAFMQRFDAAIRPALRVTPPRPEAP